MRFCQLKSQKPGFSRKKSRIFPLCLMRNPVSHSPKSLKLTLISGAPKNSPVTEIISINWTVLLACKFCDKPEPILQIRIVLPQFLKIFFILLPHSRELSTNFSRPITQQFVPRLRPHPCEFGPH
jgi:hypothetical protein